VRILFLTSRIPYPPVRGDKVRTWNFLSALASRHDVLLVSFTEGPGDEDGVREVSRVAAVETVRLSRARSYANMGFSLLSPLPYQVLYYRSLAMQRVVDRVLRAHRFDLAYVHLFRMAPFALAAGLAPSAPDREGPATALDLTDAISVEMSLSLPRKSAVMRPAYAWECRKIRRYEAVTAALFDEAWTISESDREAIVALAPTADVRVVPNGVDPALFLSPGAAPGGPVLFVGNFDVPHNADAAVHLARNVMPLVRADLAGAVLRLVGHGALEKLGLGGAGGLVETVGFVPRLADAYAGASVFAAPLRFAAGIQNKILEAMAAGLPVVTTPPGNRGLGAADGDEILVRDAPREFAAAVSQLLRDPDGARRMGERGRAFVRSRFSWSAVVDRAEALVAGRSAR